MRTVLRIVYGGILFACAISCRQTEIVEHSSTEPARVARLDEFTKKSGWLAFQQPGDSDRTSELVLLEPYRPGRIPVVFVHGLLSSPATWKTMVADLRRDETIRERYQFWAFRYPTGVSYLQSAAALRDRLRATLAWLDPEQNDAALGRMVLVGHSMGGLLSKLQVTHSDDRLWKAVSQRRFDELQGNTKTRDDIRRALFFEPLPFVQRVVFIATPHRGSQWSERPLGKLGRWIVEFPQRTRDDFTQLLSLNDGFFNISSARIPTSIDHLEPDNPLLKATTTLRFRKSVRLHSIIANGPKLPDGTAGDGVVSLASAELPESHSTLEVKATHTTVNGNRATINAVRKILLRHIREPRSEPVNPEMPMVIPAMAPAG